MAELVQLRRPGALETPETTTVDPGAPAVYLETFGCQMNAADSALISGQ